MGPAARELYERLEQVLAFCIAAGVDGAWYRPQLPPHLPRVPTLALGRDETCRRELLRWIEENAPLLIPGRPPVQAIAGTDSDAAPALLLPVTGDDGAPLGALLLLGGRSWPDGPNSPPMPPKSSRRRSRAGRPFTCWRSTMPTRPGARGT